MCCFAILLFFGGPRVAMAFWWIVGRNSWDNAWGDTGFVWKAVGFVLAPWTTLMFLILGGEPIDGWEWLLIALGILADVANWASFITRRREDIPEPYQKYVPAQLR